MMTHTVECVVASVVEEGDKKKERMTNPCHIFGVSSDARVPSAAHAE